MKQVELYTDGACSGNPGPGGWGAILVYKGTEKEMAGGEENTTNNRMELTAVIKGLSALKESCIVELYSDSKYVIDALEKGWAISWQARGWKKADKKPVAAQKFGDDRKKALEVALGKIEKDFGKGSVMKLGDSANHLQVEGLFECDLFRVSHRAN